MKKWFEILSLCALILEGKTACGQACVYHPFPDSNAVWTEVAQVDYQLNPYWFVYGRHIICGDSLINGIKYVRLQQTGYDNVHGTYSSTNCGPQSEYFYREDTNNRKVFVIPPYAPTPFSDTAIYDFNLQVGDTLKNLLYSDLKVYVILGIDSVLLADGYRKRWLIKDANMVNPDTVVMWIEGIGNLMGFFAAPSWTNGPGASVTCFEHDSITFNNPVYWAGGGLIADCDTLFVSSVKEIGREISMTIFPNPFFESISISNLSIGDRIELMDLFGRIVVESKLNSVTMSLNVSSLPSGIFFIRRISPDGKTGTRMVLKEH